MKSFEAEVLSFVLSYLLNSLWQIPLLFAVGYAVSHAMKRVGAAAEHRVWVSVLLLQALLPALSTLPSERLRTFFAWASRANGVGNGDVSVLMGAGSGLNALHVPAGLLLAIAIGYGAVSAYFLARFVWRWHTLSVLRREALELIPTGEAAVCWTQYRKRFGIEEVSIATSGRIAGPVTMGLSRRLLLLPEGMPASLTDAEFRTVIAHELAHMSRNDFLKNLIYEVLSVPANYHPLLWLTRERIMESREVICDRMAAEVIGGNEYARSLLRLASLLLQGPSIRTPHAIGIFDANAFERRLMKLTEKRNEIQGARRLVTLAACIALGVGTCGSALALRMNVDAGTASRSSDASPAAKTLTIPAGEMAGNILTKVVPKYPEEAKKERIQGKVLLDAVIGKDGSIQRLTVVSGPKELQQSSLDAVRQWTYKPYLLQGNPVEVGTTISVIYSLGN